VVVIVVTRRSIAKSLREAYCSLVFFPTFVKLCLRCSEFTLQRVDCKNSMLQRNSIKLKPYGGRLARHERAGRPLYDSKLPELNAIALKPEL